VIADNTADKGVGAHIANIEVEDIIVRQSVSGTVLCCGLILSLGVQARGVSPYLPLNLSPEIERRIEQVLILADKPIMRRPIPAAVVFDALPKACEKDKALCEEVQAYLAQFMQSSGITSLKPELAATTGDSKATIPNQHGRPVDSSWQVKASAYFSLGDYFTINAGGIVYDNSGSTTGKFTGSFVSMGFEVAQLDIGFRDHWISPLTDSSSLISTEAPTMPSITLSNYKPIGPLGFTYEIFAAEMSEQNDIVFFNSTTNGNPRLSGLQLGIEPATGYTIGLNKLIQYGGGARNGPISQFLEALWHTGNNPDIAGQSEEFGNQIASITSSMTFSGRVPFAIHFEYAGEDNAYAGSYRLGATNFSYGVDLPRLWKSFDFTYEISEWQNDWYVHHLYPLGLTNDGHVIGHWFGDNRVFGNAIGGRSQSLRLGWRVNSHDYLQMTYRDLSYDINWARAPFERIPYSRLQEAGINYTTVVSQHPLTAELLAGRDVFGESFARLGISFDFADTRSAAPYRSNEDLDSDPNVDLFVDVGASRNHLYNILDATIPNFYSDYSVDYHLGAGARRRVSNHNDLGVRVEFDRVGGNQLISFRALDYRYRFNSKFGVNGFFGAARYEVNLPAYGYYWGGGLQYLNFLPKWDLGFDIRHHEKLGRDKTLLPTDPPISPVRTRMFFDINGLSLYVSRRW